ncbi:hypothetical protein BD749_0901 [Pontibacter ramchanderi]|uniref:Uncharacterized protein n=1 Tax=Pontibacter ramchanderi TaxID=1179743 RepID=A0A2N3V2X5_9BACT|nr:hypothetical protein BD749_0901 [Pontibacter ramchanderi]
MKNVGAMTLATHLNLLCYSMSAEFRAARFWSCKEGGCMKKCSIFMLRLPILPRHLLLC